MKTEVTFSNGSSGHIDVQELLKDYTNIVVTQDGTGIDVEGRGKGKWALRFDLLDLAETHKSAKGMEDFIVEVAVELSDLSKGEWDAPK